MADSDDKRIHALETDIGDLKGDIGSISATMKSEFASFAARLGGIEGTLQTLSKERKTDWPTMLAGLVLAFVIGGAVLTPIYGALGDSEAHLLRHEEGQGHGLGIVAARVEALEARLIVVDRTVQDVDRMTRESSFMAAQAQADILREQGEIASIAALRAYGIANRDRVDSLERRLDASKSP